MKLSNQDHYLDLCSCSDWALGRGLVSLAPPAPPAPHVPQSPVDINLTHSDTNR